jgi:hypothetical protein
MAVEGTAQDKAIVMLDDLVLNNDIMAVRVSREHMKKGRKNTPSHCPGALAIIDELGIRGLAGTRITVGHRTSPNLSNRVVIRLPAETDWKWIGYIVLSPGKSGFHPERFDAGEQKTPGAMMIERWSKRAINKVNFESLEFLHSPEGRKQHLEYLRSTEKNRRHRIYYSEEIY